MVCRNVSIFRPACVQNRLTISQCEQPGHVARECTEAKDWNKVKCRREYSEIKVLEMMLTCSRLR